MPTNLSMTAGNARNLSSNCSHPRERGRVGEQRCGLAEDAGHCPRVQGVHEFDGLILLSGRTALDTRITATTSVTAYRR